MAIYRFEAEHIFRTTAIRFVREMEAEGLTINWADMDPTFTSHLILVVTCSAKVANKIRDRIWAINGGAYCDMRTISQEQLDSLYA